MVKISDIRKRKQVEKYCSNKYRKTLLWDAQRTVQNGSLMKTSPLKERFRTVPFPERFRTVLNYLRFLVLSTKNGSERFPGRCLGACFGTCFLNIKILS